jgi:hypothetical protein
MSCDRLFYSDIRSGDTFIDGNKKCVAFFNEQDEKHFLIYTKKAIVIHPKKITPSFYSISKRKLLKRSRIILIEKELL